MTRRAPLAALVALALFSTACGGDSETAGHAEGEEDDHSESSDVAADARRVEVTAKSFAFEPAEIRAKEGEDLAIELTSTDILHDFTIEELDAHVAAERGKTKQGGLTAGKPGRYKYYCTIAGHRAAGMEGTLIVE